MLCFELHQMTDHVFDVCIGCAALCWALELAAAVAVAMQQL
jgi:hypothetical protein